MKILLVRPPAVYTRYSARPALGLPLGLLYIASSLESGGFSPRLYDAQLDRDDPVKQESDASLHMGDGWETLKRKISGYAPDIVAISNLFSAQFDNAVKTARIVKEINKNTLVVVGGAHPSACPEDFFLKTPDVDIVCMGEGEHTMLDIARAFKERKGTTDIPGTAVREGAGVKLNPGRPYVRDLDSLPLPAYHLLDMEAYFDLNGRGFSGRPSWRYPGSEREVSVITSRGCPFDCVFCSIHLHMGRIWRFHSPGYVQKHLELLTSKYKVKHVHFEDDNLTLDPGRFAGILDVLKSGPGITWDTPNGVRADTLNPQLLAGMKESGCTYIILGVESGDQRVLKEVIHKNLDLDSVRMAARWCREAGLDSGSFFVIGFPGEKVSDMRRTADLALSLMDEHDLMPALFIATPLLGTELYNTSKAKGYLRKELSAANLAIATSAGAHGSLIRTEDFGPEEIASVIGSFMKGYKRIFIKKLIEFLLVNPLLLPAFAIKVLQLSKTLGFKRAVLECGGLKNCFKRRFSVA